VNQTGGNVIPIPRPKTRPKRNYFGQSISDSGNLMNQFVPVGLFIAPAMPGMHRSSVLNEFDLLFKFIIIITLHVHLNTENIGWHYGTAC
jgi:hypothetical protein